MGTLRGFPNPPALVRREQSSPAPHAIRLDAGWSGHPFDQKDLDAAARGLVGMEARRDYARVVEDEKRPPAQEMG
jgi:hypothetical protein